MSALSVTAASVAPVTSGNYPSIIDRSKTAGETITAGMPVYINTSDGKAYKTDSNASAAAAVAYGIAVSGASAGQPIAICTGGDLTAGATLTANTAYIVGAATAGDINPIADITTGWYGCLLGISISTTVLRMPTAGPIVTGVAS